MHGIDIGRDEFWFPMGNQYLLDPNERNTWGLLGPYDNTNSQDIDNADQTTVAYTAGGLMFPYDVRVKKMRVRWRINNTAAESFGFYLASFTPVDNSTADVPENIILDEVADNGGVGPNDPGNTNNHTSEWTFPSTAVVSGDVDVLTFGVKSPTADATNRYVQIPSGYILFERVG